VPEKRLTFYRAASLLFLALIGQSPKPQVPNPKKCPDFNLQNDYLGAGYFEICLMMFPWSLGLDFWNPTLLC
jgi:hypothetical protein